MESTGFTCKKNFFVQNFHVLGLFIIPKKQVWSENNNLSVTRRCRPGVGRNLYRRYLSRFKCYLSFAILRQLGWIDAPHIQNFEILKSLEQTQE
jgi:hypothetical protein